MTDNFDEEENVLKKLRSILSESPSWNIKRSRLDLVCKWHPVEAGKRAPQENSIYALGLPVVLAYGRAKSSVIYVGSAKNLRKRLAEHRRKPRNVVIERLHSAFPRGWRVTWWCLPKLHNEFLRAIEGEALWRFECTFGVVPLGNLDIPKSYYVSDYCSGIVRVAPEKAVSVMTLYKVAERMGRQVARTEREPGESGVTLVMSASDFPVRDKYRAVEFLTTEETAEREKWERQRTPQWTKEDIERERIELLSIVHPVNVAAWTPEKMASVIDSCRTLLTPRRTKAKLVRAFRAAARAVPKPHTWGEIALIQTRLLASSWLPRERIWVKVICGRELLAEGRFNPGPVYNEGLPKGWCYATEFTDLPQVKKRPEWRPESEQHEGYRADDIQKEVVYGVKIERVKSEANKRLSEEYQQGLVDEHRRLYSRIERLFQEGARMLR